MAAVRAMPAGFRGVEAYYLQGLLAQGDRDGHLALPLEHRVFLAGLRVQAQVQAGPGAAAGGGGAPGDQLGGGEEDLVPGGLQSQDGAVPGALPGHVPTHHEPQGLPSWEVAHSTYVATRRHLPKAAREDWARVWAGAVLDVCADPTSVRRWLLLYILPRCVLPAHPPVPGNSLAQVVRAACRKWRDGKAAELWREATGGREEVATEGGGAPRRRRISRKQREQEQEATQEERNARRAKVLLQENQLARAARALVSRGVDQSSAAARMEMEVKHPQVRLVEPPHEEHACPPISLNSREV